MYKIELNFIITLILNNMKRKFQHYAINTLLIGLTSLFAFGFLNLTYHLIFNNYTITFGGW